MKIGIYGCGAMGTVMGALLTKNGCPVELIDNYKDHVDAMNEKGAHIVGFMDEFIPVKAFLPEQIEGIYDVLFIFTKQTANNAILPISRSISMRRPRSAHFRTVFLSHSGLRTLALTEYAAVQFFGELLSGHLAFQSLHRIFQRQITHLRSDSSTARSVLISRELKAFLSRWDVLYMLRHSLCSHAGPSSSTMLA